MSSNKGVASVSQLSFLPPTDHQKVMSSFLSMDNEKKIENMEKMLNSININSQITEDFDRKRKSNSNGKKSGNSKKGQVYFG